MAIVTGLKYKKSGGVPIGVAELEPGDQLSPDSVFSYAGKNRLINSNFAIAQQGNNGSYVNATTEGYTVDQWIAGTVGGTGNWGVGGVIPGELGESKRYLGFNLASTTGANPTAYIGQKIESVRTLAGGKATLSFWARSNTTGKKIGCRIIQLFGSGGSPSAQVEVAAPAPITIGPTFQRYSVTFDVPSIVGKTIGNAGNDSLYVVLDYCHPTLYGGQIAGQLGLFEVGQAQFEKGEVATDYEIRPEGYEFALCQRYLEKSYSQDTVPGSAAAFGRVGEFVGVTTRTAANAVMIQFKVTKRTGPSVTIYASENGAINSISQDNGSAVALGAVSAIGDSGCQVSWTNGSGRYGGSFHYVAKAQL